VERGKTQIKEALCRPQERSRLKNLKQMYVLTDSDLCNFPIFKKKMFKPATHSITILGEKTIFI
jgi:hypothetical protein